MRIAMRLILAMALLVALLFGCAGRWDLPFFWAYLGLMAVWPIVAVGSMDPDLVKERMHPAPGGQDRHLRFTVLPFFVAQLTVAGLDVGRFHWSDSLPGWLQMVGLGGLVLCLSLSTWSIRTNRFFSPVVRIQAERGHHLVTSGPYGWIRHPGYAAAFSMCFIYSVVLGSWLSLIPITPAALLIIRRTILEDRFLRERLEGYVEYSSRVRYRLLPGVW